MRAGFCYADITPDVGAERPGDYVKQYIKYIHDPVKVRAAVFDDGVCPIAFVAVDTVAIKSNVVVGQIRAQVEAQCGIAGSHIMVAATHTHCGGSVRDSSTGYGAPDSPDLLKQLVYEHSIAPDERYCDLVVGRAVTAAVEAHRRREPVTLSIGSGREDQVSFNRRFRMRNGRIYTHPGKGNPDIMKPAGPIDPEVGVVAAWTSAGKLLGCLVNFACHCTTMSEGASADWVYYLEQTIQGAMGHDAPVVFLQGACGDITQTNNLTMDEKESGEKYARIVGVGVAAEALKVMSRAEPGEHAPLAAASAMVRVNRRQLTPAVVEESRRSVEQGLRASQLDTKWRFAKERLLYEDLYRRHPVVDLEVQALQIGRTVFLSNPSEFFVELGLAIKQGSPFDHTYVVELANGSTGYVPVPEAFSPEGGGFETVITTGSNLEPQAGPKLVQASLALAHSLKPGVAPARPQVAQPGTAWSYGVLGPELGDG